MRHRFSRLAGTSPTGASSRSVVEMIRTRSSMSDSEELAVLRPDVVAWESHGPALYVATVAPPPLCDQAICSLNWDLVLTFSHRFAWFPNVSRTESARSCGEPGQLLFSLLGGHRRRVVGHAPDPSRVRRPVTLRRAWQEPHDALIGWQGRDRR